MKNTATIKNQEARSGSLERMVRPRTITLSENVRQESPVGFMVFAHESIDVDYMVFPEEREARDYAMEQEEKANAPEDSWPIYALWASEWPNDKVSD
jgi:hypothetical protein